jgi:NAD(P)-dependent dehydrogenase (short-subunit alcohol dehydrogenase family)
MSNKVCMVTGANSGIGKETARRLAELGATTIMVCRNREKGRKSLMEIRETSGNPKVELLLADFASLDSVRSMTIEFQKAHDSLHVLVNNAGLVRLTRSVTVDGLETTFQVNYLSHFLLTRLLLDLLMRNGPSRIINVSSASHYNGHLNLEDLQMQKGYGVMRAYGQSKLAQVLFTYELARRLEGKGVTVNALHPGTVATNIVGNSLGHFSFLGKLSRLVLMGPSDGAETSVYLASSKEVEGITGKYFDKKREKESSTESRDRQLAERLWVSSSKLVNLEPSL